MDLPKEKENIFELLGALAVNPTWDLGYRFMNVPIVSDKYTPCWCPCYCNYKQPGITGHLDLTGLSYFDLSSLIDF